MPLALIFQILRLREFMNVLLPHLQLRLLRKMVRKKIQLSEEENTVKLTAQAYTDPIPDLSNH